MYPGRTPMGVVVNDSNTPALMDDHGRSTPLAQQSMVIMVWIIGGAPFVLSVSPGNRAD